MNALRRLTRAAPIAALAAAAFASPAAASTLVQADPTYLLVGGDGQSNAVSIDPLPILPRASFRVIDLTTTLQINGGCTLEAGFTNRADCGVAPRIAALLGAGDDSLT